MSVFAVSDLHLSFADTVDKPMNVFGREWENHAEKLKSAWLSIVKENDTVIVPGDISWGMTLEEARPDLDFVSVLPGKKILLRGNHDFWWTSKKKLSGLYNEIFFLRNDAFDGGDFVVCGSRGWYLPWQNPAEYSKEENGRIYRRELIRLEMSLSEASRIRGTKKLIAATHFPPLDKEHTGTEITELYQRYGVDIAIYGHLHGGHRAEAAEGKIGGIRYWLVSLDRLDAVPLKIL